MTEAIDIAVVGATGVVGEAMLEILAERKFPVGKVYALASERSVGKEVDFGHRAIVVDDLATAAGCTVIDNTSQFRYDDAIPLVVPEVNAEKIADYKNSGIIANPNCSTIQMVVALKPIYDAVGIKRINVATYQAVTGAGKRAAEELAKQTGTLLNARPLEIAAGAKQIAFNVVPQIDVLQDNGYTREEMKMVWETQKILGDEGVAVNPTAVRVPVFYGHSEAIHVETGSKISADEVRELLRKAPGVELVDGVGPGQYPTAVSESSGQDPVFVGRVREDISHPCGINLWVVADNIRKGAALNSVQIAEILAENYL